MKISPSCEPTSWTVTMLGCETRAIAWASRIRRSRACGSRRMVSPRSTLTATLRSSWSSYAEYTMPMPPSPRPESTVKRPMRASSGIAGMIVVEVGRGAGARAGFGGYDVSSRVTSSEARGGEVSWSWGSSGIRFATRPSGPLEIMHRRFLGRVLGAAPCRCPEKIRPVGGLCRGARSLAPRAGGPRRRRRSWGMGGGRGPRLRGRRGPRTSSYAAEMWVRGFTGGP